MPAAAVPMRCEVHREVRKACLSHTPNSVWRTRYYSFLSNPLPRTPPPAWPWGYRERVVELLPEAAVMLRLVRVGVGGMEGRRRGLRGQRLRMTLGQWQQPWLHTIRRRRRRGCFFFLGARIRAHLQRRAHAHTRAHALSSPATFFPRHPAAPALAAFLPHCPFLCLYVSVFFWGG